MGLSQSLCACDAVYHAIGMVALYATNAGPV